MINLLKVNRFAKLILRLSAQFTTNVNRNIIHTRTTRI